MTKPENETQLHLFDAPESQIRFLELSMGTNEWRARIHVPRDMGDARNISRQLEQRGYRVTRERADNDYTILSIHHMGPSPDVAGLFKEYGLTSGVGHVIQNPIMSAQNLIGTITDTLRDVGQKLKDPARANGLIYLTAEMFLLRAAGGNPHGKWYNSKNLLQGLSASLFLSQSAAYLFWAKKGDDRILADFDKQLLSDSPESLQRIGDAPALNERPSTGLTNHIKRALEDHPIQTGAMLNNAGMVAYIGHALLERRYRRTILRNNPTDLDALKYVNKGFWGDLIGSAISIGGWSSLLMTPKEYESYSENPLTRTYQKWRENPQTAAGATTLVSSSGRLWGAYNKGNRFQMIGEGLYIPGDLMLFFVKNHEYGGSTKQDAESLAEKISDVMLAKPMLLSPEHQQQFYAQTANYLTTQMQALDADHPMNDADKKDAIETIKTTLDAHCSASFSERFDLMVGSARRLISAFPETQQHDVGQTLSHALPELQGLHANSQELKQWLCPETKLASNSKVRHPSMQSVAPLIGQIAHTIPGENAGNNAIHLYQVLSRHLQKGEPNSKVEAKTTRVQMMQPVVQSISVG